MDAPGAAPLARQAGLSRRTLVVVTVIALAAGLIAVFIGYAVVTATRNTNSGGVAVTPPASSDLAIGDRAPLDFHLAQLGGGSPVSLATLAAGHPTVINLFASWCTACAAELNAFGTVSRSQSSRVAFVGIDTNDPAPGRALTLVRAHGARYPVASDSAALAVAKAYGVAALPVTFFIDRHGRIAAEVLGAETTASLTTRVAALASGRPVP